MSNFYYIGYGFVVSSKEEKHVDITNTNAYKILRACLPDRTEIEISNSAYNKRFKLEQIISKEQTVDADKKVIIVPTIETLGATPEAACYYYENILLHFHIMILNHPEFSTVTEDGDILVDCGDLRKRMQLVAELACIKPTVKGRKAISPDAKFRKVFWAWQNYYINTDDALSLLNCSKQTLYTLTKEFMTSDVFNHVYHFEFQENMKGFEDDKKYYDYFEKPVRGIVPDDKVINIVAKIKKDNGMNGWTESAVIKVLAKWVPYDDVEYYEGDYIRFKQNCMYGRAAMSAATKKYSKGPEYVIQLEEELSKM